MVFLYMFCPDQQFQIVIAESAKVFNILAMLLNIAEFACYIAIFWDQARKILNLVEKRVVFSNHNISFQYQYNKTSSKNPALRNMQELVHRRKRQVGQPHCTSLELLFSPLNDLYISS